MRKPKERLFNMELELTDDGWVWTAEWPDGRISFSVDAFRNEVEAIVAGRRPRKIKWSFHEYA